MDIEETKSTRSAPHAEDEAREFAIQAARIAVENKAEDVDVLDLRGLSTIADFFVIGTGSSNRQMDAVVDFVKVHARSIGREPFKLAGTREGKWVLADYVDVVVHLFDQEHRDFYDLAGLWGDAPRVPWAVNGQDEADAELS